MNILKNSDTCRKTRPARLIAVCLIGAASIGLSAFSFRLNTSHSEDVTPFVGTWEAKYQGTTFLALHLKLENGSLGGTCDHGERLTLVNGELIPDGSKLSSHKIVETKLSGKKLLLKLEGDENSSTFPLEFALTGADQAEGRIVVASDSGTPPPKKPWHFVRIGQ